jgi:hypothetical protein
MPIHPTRILINPLSEPEVFPFFVFLHDYIFISLVPFLNTLFYSVLKLHQFLKRRHWGIKFFKRINTFLVPAKVNEQPYEVGTQKAKEKVKSQTVFCVITFYRNEIIFNVPLFSYTLPVRFSATTYIESDYVLYCRLCWTSQICTRAGNYLPDHNSFCGTIVPDYFYKFFCNNLVFIHQSSHRVPRVIKRSTNSC